MLDPIYFWQNSGILSVPISTGLYTLWLVELDPSR
jgi:hypothetical protein